MIPNPNDSGNSYRQNTWTWTKNCIKQTKGDKRTFIENLADEGDKRTFIENLADEKETVAKIQNIAALYKIIKTDAGYFRNSEVPVKHDINGYVITGVAETDPEMEITLRDHFQQRCAKQSSRHSSM